jgi:hypothetical protein
LRRWTNGIIICIYMEISQENSLCSHVYLKQEKISFFLLDTTWVGLMHRRMKQGLLGGWYHWEGGGGRDRSRRATMIQKMSKHVYKCKNNTCWNLSWNGREGIKESGGKVNSSMIYLIHCKNFCKCHKVPPPSTAIIIIKKGQHQE